MWTLCFPFFFLLPRFGPPNSLDFPFLFYAAQQRLALFTPSTSFYLMNSQYSSIPLPAACQPAPPVALTPVLIPFIQGIQESDINLTPFIHPPFHIKACLPRLSLTLKSQTPSCARWHAVTTHAPRYLFSRKTKGYTLHVQWFVVELWR